KLAPFFCGNAVGTAPVLGFAPPIRPLESLVAGSDTDLGNTHRPLLERSWLGSLRGDHETGVGQLTANFRNHFFHPGESRTANVVKRRLSEFELDILDGRDSL